MSFIRQVSTEKEVYRASDQRPKKKAVKMENVEKIEPATSTADSDTSANLHELQKRLQSLKIMQREYVGVEKDFHRHFYELDMEYQKKRQAVYNRRKAVINGTGDDSEQTPAELDIEIANAMQKLQLDIKDLSDVDTAGIKGIPGFWLRALKNCTPNLVRECDEKALKYLTDIKLNLVNEPELSFILEFEFAENPFFQQSTLTKQYFLDCDTNDEFNGFSIVKTVGCEIQWNDGMNVTEKDADSFFSFFNPPKDAHHGDAASQLNESQPSNILDELQHDFEIGLVIKEKLIPNAILYYLNEPEQFIECATLNEFVETNADGAKL